MDKVPPNTTADLFGKAANPESSDAMLKLIVGVVREVLREERNMILSRPEGLDSP